MAADIVLAGGEEESGCRERAAVAKRNQPLAVARNNRLGSNAAQDLAAVLFGAAE